jgi:hypothetical protein
MLRVAMVIEAIVCFLFRARLWRNSVVEHLDKPMLRIYRIWLVYIACDQVSERTAKTDYHCKSYPHPTLIFGDYIVLRRDAQMETTYC